MKKHNVKKIQEVTANALADQVKRTLQVARIRGWRFPASADVALTVTAATPLVTEVNVRMDDVTVTNMHITTEDPSKDIADIADTLVAQWLGKHATAKPTGKVA